MIYYSKYSLNTYYSTPYFESHIQQGYPLHDVLQTCGKFLALPPNLRRLSEASRKWAENVPVEEELGATVPPGIENYYDNSGHEIDPETGDILTDSQINELWGANRIRLSRVEDIRAGKLSDPLTWRLITQGFEASAPRPSPHQLMLDIASHGRDRVMKDYGLTASQLPLTGGVVDGLDIQQTKAAFKKRTDQVMRSKYFKDRPKDLSLLKQWMKNVDIMDDLAGGGLQLFLTAEEVAFQNR